MSDHLPECPAPLCDWGYSNAECMGYEDCHHLCVCDALRACEQRVSKEALQDAKARESNGITWAQAYSAALDAAREAVWESVGPSADAFSQMVFGRALAAIDALREEEK